MSEKELLVTGLHLFLRVCGAGLFGSNFLLLPSSLNCRFAQLVEIDFVSICHARENDFFKSNRVAFLLKTPLHLKHRDSMLILKPMSEATSQRYEDMVLMD